MTGLQLHGVRGSYPLFDPRCRRYGGNTSCYSLETAEGLLVIDAGTGIARLGDGLGCREKLPPITILFTHVHLDHIVGLPSFKPLLRQNADITIWLDPVHAEAWREALQRLVAKPIWPVSLDELGAKIRFETMPDGTVKRYGLEIQRCAISHPQGAVSYRIQRARRSLVLATDREHGDPALDRAFIEFARGTDVLLHDAQYTAEELQARRGWGHSSWQQSVEVAAAAAARSLVLVSHEPGRQDQEIESMLAEARRIFPETRAGEEGMIV